MRDHFRFGIRRSALAVALLLTGAATAASQSYTYDEAGRLIRVAYPEGSGIAYFYDANDSLLQVTSVALPAAPTGLQITRISATTVEVRWQDRSNNETGFAIMRRLAGTSEWTEIATVSAGTTTFVDTNADSADDYVYRVVARNGDGDSVQTAELGPSSPAAVNQVIPGGGSTASVTGGRTNPLQVGYAEVEVLSGPTPYGTAVFSLEINGNIVSEAGVPASRPTTKARIFIDYREGVTAASGQFQGVLNTNTGVAIVNQGEDRANLTFTLRGTSGGTILATGSGMLDRRAHLARFVNELQSIAPDFVVPASFPTDIGFASLEIASDQPLSVVALRLSINQRGETLLTTTPAADMTRPSTPDPLYFPQVADGGGYITSVVLLNTTSTTQNGTIDLFQPDGAPLAVTPVGGQTGSSFPYSITPEGTFVLETDGSGGTVRSGWARVAPTGNSTSPVGAGLYQLSQNGVVVTESGIPSARPTERALFAADLSGGHNTGLAVVNPGNAPLTDLTLRAYELDGVTPVPGTTASTVSLPALGQTAQFVAELIPGVPDGFVGVVEMTSSAAFAPLTLRALTNGRGDFLLTTFPTADLDTPAPAPIVFPQIVDGGGYQTEFILIGPAGEANATLRFFDPAGNPLALADVP